MGAAFDLVKYQLKCSYLNQEFNLYLEPPIKGLPYGTNFDIFCYYSTLMVFRLMFHPCSHRFSIFSSDGTISTVSQQTSSNNLVLTDNYLQGCISRDLVYHSPTHNPFE